ncbi:MAG TPA: hypothetical protein VGK90_04685, partial [Rhizomicrobium sp.]
MNSRMRSFLGGAAVAAALILPAAAANGDWITWPTKSFNDNALRVEDIVGRVTVNVRDGGPISVDVTGTKDRVNGMSVREEGGKVVVEGSSTNEYGSVWDWHKWFNFSMDYEPRADNLYVKVTVPRGTRVEVTDLVGDATIGDTQGELRFDAAASKARIGH